MNQTLDINTERGKIAAADQIVAAEMVFRNSENSWFVHTKTNDAAVIDGFVIKDGFAVAIAEIKSRDNTLEEMMGEFNGEWLLTYQKLLGIQTISRLMLIPAFGFVYLKPSACVLAIRLTDANGLIVCSHHEKRTQTQATCNGGTATRLNSFIDVRNAKIFR